MAVQSSLKMSVCQVVLELMWAEPLSGRMCRGWPGLSGLAHPLIAVLGLIKYPPGADINAKKLCFLIF